MKTSEELIAKLEKTGIYGKKEKALIIRAIRREIKAEHFKSCRSKKVIISDVIGNRHTYRGILRHG